MDIADKITRAKNDLDGVYAAGYTAGQQAAGGGGGSGSYDEGYNDGRNDGWSEGYDEGHSVGQQAEYDRFWDAYQQNGDKTAYDSAFMYGHWTDDIYNPKYPLKFEGSNGGRQVFSSFANLTDVKVPIYAKNTRITYTFSNCANLKTIPLLHLEGVTDFNSAFVNCVALENITIGGSIEKNISFAQSTKLTKASLTSIMEALSLTATGQTLTLSKTAVETAFGSTTASEWTALAATKPNWTISLV